MNEFLETIKDAIHLDAFSTTKLLHTIMRSIMIYFWGITLARFNKKLLGIRTPFNFLLFVMMGSISAMAIVHGEFFLPIICAFTFLILLNGLMTMLVFYYKPIELFVKGKEVLLVKNGNIQWKQMRKNFITHKELFNELYNQLHTKDLKTVSAAYLTSDGTINFITKNN